jgi:Flp pilus assembly pilin Flp
MTLTIVMIAMTVTFGAFVKNQYDSLAPYFGG